MPKHRTNIKKSPYKCRYCGLTWEKLSWVHTTDCTRKPTYRREDIPDNMLRISDMKGVKPKDKNNPDAYYIYPFKTRQGWETKTAALWSIESVLPTKEMSSAQKNALRKAQRVNEVASQGRYRGGFENAKEIDWIIRNYSEDSEFYTLDTETTGLGDDDQVIQVSIVRNDGTVMLDTLIYTHKEISPDAFEVHGISQECLEGAPRYPDVHEKIKNIITDKEVIYYNSDFDKRLLRQTQKLYDLNEIPHRSDCLMIRTRLYLDGWGGRNVRYYKLGHAVNIFMQEEDDNPFQYSGPHSAVGDSMATLFLARSFHREAVRTKAYIDSGEWPLKTPIRLTKEIGV